MQTEHPSADFDAGAVRLRETEPLRRLAQTRGDGEEPGDAVPRPVTRGESTETTIAHIDWFACTFLPERDSIVSIIESVFLVPYSEWEQRAGGWQGYETRVDLGDFGLLAYGGEHQRGTAHIELNAHGCARIQDWNAVRVWCEAYGVRITRVDLAHDDFSGQSVSIAQARAWLDLISPDPQP